MCTSPSVPACNSSGKRSTCLTTLISAECAQHSFRAPPRLPSAELQGLRAWSRKTSAQPLSEHLLQHPAHESCNLPLSSSSRPRDCSGDGLGNFTCQVTASFSYLCIGIDTKNCKIQKTKMLESWRRGGDSTPALPLMSLEMQEIPISICRYII